MSRTATYRITCAHCPNHVQVTVSSVTWHDDTKRCAERTAEIHGFTAGKSGPVCMVHKEST